jgi:hypothetical protein
MVAGYCGGQLFVITRQTSESGSPAKRTFHHPSSGQQDKSSFGLMVLDYFQAQTVLCGVHRWLLSGVALIHVSNLHVLSSRYLHGLG